MGRLISGEKRPSASRRAIVRRFSISCSPSVNCGSRSSMVSVRPYSSLYVTCTLTSTDIPARRDEPVAATKN